MSSVLIEAVLSSSPDYDRLFESLSWPSESCPGPERVEALTAVSIACLTLYDMCKAVDKAMIIEQVRLLEKKGGRSGHYKLSPES